MKKTLLLSLLSFAFIALNAQTQITYKSFGDGWVIPVNSNIEVDLDEDGVIDFYINQHPDEIGFSPIFDAGCFSSPSGNAYTSFNARELTLFDEGDFIQMTPVNLFDYIDDDRGSGYSLNGGFANGWANQDDVYLGFAIVVNSGVRNGWMKASINTSNNSLIIKEWAYTEIEANYQGGITVGDKGETTSVKRLDNINGVAISPNPANEKVQINFDYSGAENLSVIIQNNVGQEVYRNAADIPVGSTSLNITTSDWTNGVYFIRFETTTSIRTERLSVAK